MPDHADVSFRSDLLVGCSMQRSESIYAHWEMIVLVGLFAVASDAAAMNQAVESKQDGSSEFSISLSARTPQQHYQMHSKLPGKNSS